MEWIDASKQMPTEYKDYVCLIGGKLAIATLYEFLYDVRRPNWNRDGVTHYLAGLPTLPGERE